MYLLIEGLSQVRPNSQHFWELSCHPLKELKIEYESNNSLIALIVLQILPLSLNFIMQHPKEATMKRI